MSAISDALQAAALEGYENGRKDGYAEGFAACRELAAKIADKFSRTPEELQSLLARCDDAGYGAGSAGLQIAEAIRSLTPEAARGMG